MRITPELQLLLRTKSFRDKDTASIYDIYTLFPDKDKIDKDKFLLISRVFHEVLLEYVMFTGHLVKLPNRLGTLSVRKSQVDPDKRPIDFGHFNKTGEVIRHRNPTTEGAVLSFVWDNKHPHCILKRAEFFKFKPALNIRQHLSHIVNTYLTANKYYPRDYAI